jgi:hypothetical protein
MMPNGKASAATPKVAGEENVELKNMMASKPSPPPEEDIMHLARIGDVGAVRKLFESGKFNSSYADNEGITPLHVRSLPM